jgi:rhamnose utilization protein RhaD (predicted bifunctional aldolase and dehydrogenase)
MKSAWVDSDAKAALDHWAKAGVGAELALRVYSTRLLGREPKLVLHGGGNTSVKTRINDLFGEEAEVLCVKGSGWDMASIEPAGMPAVRLEPLRKLRARDAVPDEEMVRVQRTGLIDPLAPNPSVETLLHAFAPHDVRRSSATGSASSPTSCRALRWLRKQLKCSRKIPPSRV